MDRDPAQGGQGAELKEPQVDIGSEDRRPVDDWFRLVVEAAPSALLMVDQNRRIVMVNREAEDLFGYGRQDLLGAPIEALVPERFRARHPGYVEAFFAAPKARAMGAGRDLFGRRRDGTEVPIEIGLTPIDTPRGPCTLASVIDITERKRAEERFRLVVDAAPHVMLILDRVRRITLANRKTEDLFGYAPQALIGQVIDVLLPERCREQLTATFVEPGARATGVDHETYGRHKDGGEFPIEMGLTPIETPEGPSTLVSITDIRERKRAEALQERLASIVESSADAILSTDLDGAITSWNRGAEGLFGYAAAEVIGRPALMLVPERLVNEERRVTEQLRRNEPVDHYETVRRRKDGSEVDVSIRLSPIRNAAGELVGDSRIDRDITELKRRDAELQRSNAELEQFAYVASHDLQEPLRMVANYTELLAQRYRGKLDEKADKYIHYASDGARRMQRLVADLLAYSRVGSQGKPLLPVAFGDVLDGVLRTLRPLLRETGATIERQHLPMVLADEVQLSQLLQNLIGNAIKFRSAAPPRILIEAVSSGGRVALLDRRQRHRHRHAVCRSDLSDVPAPPRARQVRGQRDRARHRQAYRRAPWRSDLGRVGARRRGDLLLHTARLLPLQGGTMSKIIQVLLVEDNPGDADLTKETLEASKLHVETSIVIDGAQALAYLHKRPPYEQAESPDLILLDLNLPKVSGAQVLAEIKRHEALKKIPIVILTSSDAEQDVAKSYELGANCYVTKPVGLAAFQAIVSSVEGFWFAVVKLP